MSEQHRRTAFIIGGTGQVGTAVTPRLLADGWSILVAHRGGQHGDPTMAEHDVTTIRLDRDDTDALMDAARGHDLVVDTVAYDARHAGQLARLAGDVGSLVVISTASVYCDADGRNLDTATDPDSFPEFPVQISEDQLTIESHSDSYSAQKADMERALLAVGDLPVSILRAGAIHGPFSSMLREWFFIKRARDGRRRVVLAYEGASRFSTIAAANLAELVALCAAAPRARVLNAADQEALSSADIAHTVFDVMEHDIDVVPLTGPPRGNLGANPWGVPKPMVLSMRRALDELGYHQPVTYRDAVAADVEWITDVVDGAARRQQTWRDLFPTLAERYGADAWFDYDAEDAFLA
jgi:nucleoside-diphosphate-sugar epimerase